jgi:hypothetical protein
MINVAVRRAVNSMDYRILSKKSDTWTCLKNEQSNSFVFRLEASTRSMDKDCLDLSTIA